MKTCSCGKQLANNADRCPNCGKVFTNRAAWLGLIVAGFILLLAAMTIYHGMQGR